MVPTCILCVTMQAKVMKTCKKQAQTQVKESKCKKNQAQVKESRRKKRQAQTQVKESQRKMCTCGSRKRPSRCSNTPACLALAKDLCLWHMLSQVKSRSCLGTHSHHNYSLRVALTPCSRCRCTQSCCFGICGPTNTATAKKDLQSVFAKSAPWFGQVTIEHEQFGPEDENGEAALSRSDATSIMCGIFLSAQLTRPANPQVRC